MTDQWRFLMPILLVGVIGCGHSVLFAPIGFLVSGSCADLLAHRLDIVVLDPFCLVRKTFVV